MPGLKVQHWLASALIHGVVLACLLVLGGGHTASEATIKLNLSLLDAPQGSTTYAAVEHKKIREAASLTPSIATKVSSQSTRVAPTSAQISTPASLAVATGVQSSGRADGATSSTATGGSIGNELPLASSTSLSQTLWSMMNGRKRYPLMARRMGIQGKVLIEAVIDGQGRLQKAEIKQSAGNILDQDALTMLKAVTPIKTERFRLAASTTILIPMVYVLE